MSTIKTEGPSPGLSIPVRPEPDKMKTVYPYGTPWTLREVLTIIAVFLLIALPIAVAAIK